MGIPADINARQYYRVAFQRFEDGELLVAINRPRAAVYLAGYGVECMLKALILASTPAKDRPAVLAGFRGSVAHDIDWLREHLVRRVGHLPADVARQVSLVSSWSVDLRYEPGPGDMDDAREFLAATGAVLRWADNRV